jgi:thiol-disulfide isomerase/thioredoxin
MQQLQLLPPIFYLESDNFEGDRLIPIVNQFSGGSLFDKKTIIMIQGNFCGYCTQFKPIFQEVANKLYTENIDFATIQIDQKDQSAKISDDQLKYIIKTPIRGVPTIVKFQNGQHVSTYDGNQDYNDLYRWILQN